MSFEFVHNPLFSLLLAYLTGSIPTAVWVGKAFHGIDVREHGSGNAGATNVMRVLGVKTGIPVLLADMLKGWISVYYLGFFISESSASSHFSVWQISCGLAAVLGHIFPVFAGFRGGKGVATIFGVLLAISLQATLLSGAVFMIVLLISSYVSLSSIVSSLSFPLWNLVLNSGQETVVLYFSIFVPLAIMLTHRANIRRLIRGEEKKASFLRKRKEPSP